MPGTPASDRRVSREWRISTPLYRSSDLSSGPEEIRLWEISHPQTLSFLPLPAERCPAK
jgi:hypothetical protein